MKVALKTAFGALLRYLVYSGGVFVVSTSIYIAYFCVVQPKYTFLTGNSICMVLTLLFLAASLWTTCLSPARRSNPDVERFKLASSSVVTGILLLYGLHATVITIVERSVSMNVLRYLAQRGQSQPFDTIQTNFIETFVMRDKAVCKRLDEQVHLGNVAIENGRYVLTPKGTRTFKMLDTVTHITAADAPQNAVTCGEP